MGEHRYLFISPERCIGQSSCPHRVWTSYRNRSGAGCCLSCAMQPYGCAQPPIAPSCSCTGETKNLWRVYPDWYILAQSAACQENMEDDVFRMHYRLPQTQCARIVIQWWWTTSNNCIPAQWRAASDFPCEGLDGMVGTE